MDIVCEAAYLINNHHQRITNLCDEEANLWVKQAQAIRAA